MKIIKIQKKNNKYKITLENNTIIETYDEIIIKENILYKKEITDELKSKIEKENKYYEIYNNILKYIKIKLRSEYEIRENIKKNEIDKFTEEKLIKKLKDSKLIDDKTYTYAYIHDRIKFSNDGPYKIKKELLKNKIEENLIEDELNKLDRKEIYEKLKKQILKKINANNKYSNNMIKQKLINYFINQGYEKSMISEIIQDNQKEDNNIIKKEYEKLYNKYKTKYNEYELNRVIKQKLYQKGFSIDEINNIEQR